MELNIHKASSVDGSELPDLDVVAHHTIKPDDPPYRMQQDGYLLAHALINHLPGGTLDALVATLLQHKASQLHVAYRAPVPETGDLELTRILMGYEESEYWALHQAGQFFQPLRILTTAQVEQLIHSYGETVLTARPTAEVQR